MNVMVMLSIYLSMLGVYMYVGSSKDGRNSGDPDENDDLHVYIEGKLVATY